MLDSSKMLMKNFIISFLVFSIQFKYWVGQKVHLGFFCKIKDTFFIFTKNFTDLDILSYVGYLPLLAPGGWRPEVLLNIFQCIIQPTAKELFGQNVNSTKKLCKPLLTRSISHSTFSIHGTNLYALLLCLYLS